MPQLLGPCIADVGPAAAAVAAQGLLLGGGGSSSWNPAQHHQLQQQRGAAAKKKATASGKKGAAAKGKQQAGGKKQKQKMESKPFEEKDPLNQKLIAMLVPGAEPLRRPLPQQRAAAAAGLQYLRQHNQRHQAWAADMRTKLSLKLAALKALPPDLRAAAEEEDLTAFPLTRHFLYDTPPDAYKE